MMQSYFHVAKCNKEVDKKHQQLCDLSRIELRKGKKDIGKAYSTKVEAGPLITINHFKTVERDLEKLRIVKKK